MNYILYKNSLALKTLFRSFKQKTILSFVFILAVNYASFGQTSIDLSVGSSFQDDVKAQMAIRNQLSPGFNVGLELQTGSPKYRFVSTKAIRDGYSFSLSLPFAYMIQDQEKIQLYGIGRVGARFQGIIDPDNNDERDSILASNAIIGEFGFMTTFNASEKVILQSGITFPFAYETSPLPITEYTQVRLHMGASIKNNNTTFFAHSSLGAAFGATGDTYKYIWAIDVGARFSLGKGKNDRFKLIQTSF